MLPGIYVYFTCNIYNIFETIQLTSTTMCVERLLKRKQAQIFADYNKTTLMIFT